MPRRRFADGALRASAPSCLVAVAAALVLQPSGCNQTAHLALVKSLYDGTPRIDRYAGETCDTAYIDGHYYAAKAPGLALLTLPWYAGAPARGPRRRLRADGLARGRRRCSSSRGARRGKSRSGERRWRRWSCSCSSGAPRTASCPDTGRRRRSLLGLGSLVLAVLDALLRARSCRDARLRRVLAPPPRPPVAAARAGSTAAAGVLAGLAVVVEFPLGIVAVALAGIRRTRADRRRTLAGAAPRGRSPLAVVQHVGVRQPARPLVRERRDRAGHERSRRDRRERRGALRPHVPEPASGGASFWRRTRESSS